MKKIVYAISTFKGVTSQQQQYNRIIECHRSNIEKEALNPKKSKLKAKIDGTDN